MPRVSREKFNCFFSVDGAWGVYSQTRRARQWQAVIAVDEDELVAREIGLGRKMPTAKKVLLAGREVPFSQGARNGKLYLKLKAAVKIKPGQPLEIRL